MPHFSTHSILATGALCLAALAHADPCDPALISDPPALATFSTPVAMTTWDPDRSGPLPERLVLGGELRIPGSPSPVAIASWDGKQWHTFGPGLTPAPAALASIFGNVIAGGAWNLQQVGGESLGTLAQWDGTSWQSLSGGTVNGSVGAMKAMGNWLYVGGSFTAAGSTDAANIARWNGLTWQKLATGLNGKVNAIEIFNGEIVAAGEFISGPNAVRYVARWDGQAWRPFGSGPGMSIRALAVYNGKLAACGAGGVRIWNGAQWSILSNPAFSYGSIARMHGIGDRLFIAGFFNGASPSSFNSILAWDGTQWSFMNEGLTMGEAPAEVHAMATYQGDLYAGGVISHSGSAPAMGLARWTASDWRSVGSGWSKYGVSSISATSRALFAMDDAANVATWESQTWRSLPPIPGGTDYTDRTYSFGDALYAAVRRTVFRFDTNAWTQIGTPFGSSIYSLVDFDGSIIAGGDFGVARWDGVQWKTMGAGFARSVHTGPLLTDLIVYKGDLYALGTFERSGTTPMQGFARWNGSDWIALDTGGSPNPSVAVLFRDELVTLGSGTFRAWNGQSWRTVGSQLSGEFNVAAVFGGRLVAGGFNLGEAGVSLVEWSGDSWRQFGPQPALSDGRSPRVNTLRVFDGALCIGGYFDRVGNEGAINFYRISACHLCPTDLTNDAIVDDADFCNFILSYDLMDCTDPAMPASCPSDFNADGLVDDADFTRFVVDYAAFLCPEAD
ncbi:MAG: hypothetical protein J0L78_09030 [Planctomycetes bacterium]|nr:hypothetical protein [Planctomycetota bacterium]